MSKQGMKRPERTHTQPKNTTAAVPEIQGKAKWINVNKVDKKCVKKLI